MRHARRHRLPLACRILGHRYALDYVDERPGPPRLYVITCERCLDLLATGEDGPHDPEDYR